MVRSPRRLLADRAYDARSLRDELAARRIKAVIPPNPTRKHPHRYDKTAYKGRNVIERMFCRLKDFRRIATRYDKRADVFLSAILLAAAITWWIKLSPDPRPFARAKPDPYPEPSGSNISRPVAEFAQNVRSELKCLMWPVKYAKTHVNPRSLALTASFCRTMKRAHDTT